MALPFSSRPPAHVVPSLQASSHHGYINLQVYDVMGGSSWTRLIVFYVCIDVELILLSVLGDEALVNLETNLNYTFTNSTIIKRALFGSRKDSQV